jgi:hypothetical protein
LLSGDDTIPLFHVTTVQLNPAFRKRIIDGYEATIINHQARARNPSRMAGVDFKPHFACSRLCGATAHWCLLTSTLALGGQAVYKHFSGNFVATTHEMPNAECRMQADQLHITFSAMTLSFLHVPLEAKLGPA